MEWFDTFKKTIEKTANKTYEKSSEVIEVAKLNLKINSIESGVEKSYCELGKMVYNKFKSEEEVWDECKPICEDIDKKQAEISAIKENVAIIKNVKKCSACGEFNDKTAHFCKKCGEKFPEE